jgi:transglutaminase-like putative cysteine protease
MTTPGKDSVEYTYLVLYNIKAGDFDCRIDKFASAQAVKNGVTEFKTLVNDILKNNPNTTRYAQVQYLNDWLTKHNSYSSAYASGDFSPIVWSPISALRGTTGDEGPVCEGYSRAFKILCDGLNIPCILAVGDAIGSKGATPESHMWNEVKMNDGLWYAVDVTWNDPMVGGGAQAMESGAENENWLLLGKNDVVNEWDGLTFAESHPNSLVYGQGESSAWDYDNETLIADTHFDIANGVESVAEPENAKVYSILGVYLGSYQSVESALSSLESGIYIINGRKVLVK